MRSLRIHTIPSYHLTSSRLSIVFMSLFVASAGIKHASLANRDYIAVVDIHRVGGVGWGGWRCSMRGLLVVGDAGHNERLYRRILIDDML